MVADDIDGAGVWRGFCERLAHLDGWLVDGLPAGDPFPRPGPTMRSVPATWPANW